jgi:endonuclease/exonuclease/phosphatase (EEP) superfamily protein YafD
MKWSAGTMIPLILALIVVLATAIPLVRHDLWWIRAFDFPRAQILGLGLLGMALMLLYWTFSRRWEQGVLLLLAASVAYQAIIMFPYTRAARHQVEPSSVTDAQQVISLLIANVLMTNRAYESLLDIVRRERPDVVLTVETDAGWEQALRGIEEEYPFSVKQPLDNTYGMLLHSRLALHDSEIRFLVEPDIPSIHTDVELRSGSRIRFYGLHPRPPAPDEATNTSERDAELLIVARMVRERDEPAIVAGDLNDVAWSHTTRLFLRISGTLDPRIGRGTFNTYHADYFFLRYPLDHIFHTSDFRLVELRRLEAWGSDHFPMLVRLEFDPSARAIHDEPRADESDHEEADERIERADP